MKWITFSIFCILYLTLLLFADHRQAAATINHEFAAAYDLSTEATVLHAPAEVQSNGWNAAQIPAERLVAPLILITPSATGNVGLREIVAFEKQNGVIPPGAFIVAKTAGANFDFDALRFLSEARGVYGLGAPGRVDFVSNAPFIAAKGMYVVENLSLPERVKNNAIVTIAPEKASAGVAPVRLIALERAPK
jgi:kynurenine formamidase